MKAGPGPNYVALYADGINSHMEAPLTGIVAQHLLRVAVAEVMAVEDVTEGVPTAVSAILHRKLPQASHPAAPPVLLPDETGFVPTGPRRRHPLSWPANRTLRSRLRAARTALWRAGLYTSVAQGRRPSARRGAGRTRHASKANQRLGIAALLFGLTLISCLFAGAEMVEGPTTVNWNLLDGLPYAMSLLAILGAHEFGHYLTARRLRSPTSLPYFIPMPFGFGTLGAVINMVVPPRNRRHLLAIAVAGPLAGLAVAIPVLLIGLEAEPDRTAAGRRAVSDGGQFASLLRPEIHRLRPVAAC